MKSSDFYALVDRRCELTRNILIEKGKEYSTDADKLHNFKQAASIEGCSVGNALRGMLLKHWTSVKDMVEAMDKGAKYPESVIDEKIGDSVNYLILLEAVLKEQ